MPKDKCYVGLNAEAYGGMNPTGNIIRDAWVFGLIPETEDCTGWTMQGIDALYDKVSAAWTPYGHLVSNLPKDLRERHERIYTAAVLRAQSLGWHPDLEFAEDPW